VAVSIDLSGKVTLVTGGATGIGAGVVRLFAEAGSAVFFSYTSNAAGAEALADELRKAGHRVGAARADLAKTEDAARLVAACEAALGPIDHLVNVAGITDPHAFLEVTPEIWDKTLNINLRGMYFVSQHAARSMVARKAQGCSIVMMSSVHGKVSSHDHSHYEASKGGINMMTQALAIELGGHGIRVNCVAPGAIEVERYAHMERYDPERWGRAIPLGRVGLPADIAPLCLFLCSPGAAYISGETIYVDGGLTAKMVPL
jgi:NAD(P)-dependent dehydrogenase (short-subunit alcohol dehydrogenase family)